MDFTEATLCEYLEDTYNFKGSALILTCEDVDPETPEFKKFGPKVITLDRTIFHAQGGGQPCDLGDITFEDESNTKFDVRMVKMNAQGVVLHYGEFRPAEASVPTAPTGMSVRLCIDEAHRRMCARLHSAGHLIDVAMARLGLLEGGSLKAAKGYHFNDGPYVEFKGTTDAELATLPEKLNEVLNEVITDDIGTVVEALTAEETGARCDCDSSSYPLGESGTIRVVTIGGMPCPCGGTHVKSTKELQGLSVTKVKKKKDIYKISYRL